jgi:hypothetical protein
MLRWWIMLAAYALVASLVLLSTLTDDSFHFHDPDTGVAFVRMVDGTAQRPFVLRAFPSFVVRTMTALTPQPVREKIEHVWDGKFSLKLFGYTGSHATEYTWAVLMLFVALIGFGLTMREIIREFFDLSELSVFLASVLSIAIIPLGRSYFIYDYPNLLIFSLCILFIARQNWRAFYPMFVIACLTKETAILLPLVVLLNIGRFGDRRRIIVHLAAQIIIWAAVTAGLGMIFADNPGTTLEFHLFDYNLLVLTQPSQFLQFSHFLLPRALNVMLVSLIAILVFTYWRLKPKFLKRSLLIVVPLVSLSILFGWIDETRGYFEVLPILYCLGLHSVMRLFDDSGE